jgi:hypothetical protein
LVALGFFIAGIVEDGGDLVLDPYTNRKKVASMAILLASCCDIGRCASTPPHMHARGALGRLIATN